MNVQDKWLEPLCEAIPLRHSSRAYLPEPLSNEYIIKINEFITNLPAPFTYNTELRIFEATPGKKLYNNGINPINNLALISQTDLVSISKTGFLGELVMLYAVSLGLDTCWFGHYKLAEVGKYIENISSVERIRESTLGYGYGNHVDVGMRVICCMPFGRKNMDTKRLVDFVAGKKSANRKPLTDLLESSELLESIPQGFREVLELAKLAPSAANSQMWRFGFHDDFRTITVSKPVGYKHFKWEHPDVDIGMCAAHVWLGLVKKGYNPEANIHEDADRAFWAFHI